MVEINRNTNKEKCRRIPLWHRIMSETNGTINQIGGREISLYRLENGIIRKRFPDPRLHFALNCASLGCPRMPRQAFSGKNMM
jgi:hypothetical protein